MLLTANPLKKHLIPPAYPPKTALFSGTAANGGVQKSCDAPLLKIAHSAEYAAEHPALCKGKKLRMRTEAD
jgi:hypothetical protein